MKNLSFQVAQRHFMKTPFICKKDLSVSTVNKTTSTTLQSIFKAALVETGMYTGLSHYLHNLLLILCLGQESSLMSPNTEWVWKICSFGTGERGLRWSFSRGISSSGASGDIFIKMKLHIPWWRCQKMQLQQTNTLWAELTQAGWGGPQPWLRKLALCFEQQKRIKSQGLYNFVSSIHLLQHKYQPNCNEWGDLVLVMPKHYRLKYRLELF